MTHRERVLTTLDHHEPDRVPRTNSLTASVIEEFKRRTGCNEPSKYWDFDIASVGFEPPDPPPDLEAIYGRYFEDLDFEWVLEWDGEYPGEWGVAGRPAHFHHFSAPVAPMAGFTSLKQLESYPFPDYLQDSRHDHLEETVRTLKDEGYPVNCSIGWIFQTAWNLRTRPKLFIDFYDNPEFAEMLLDRITAIRIDQATRFAESGVDMISYSDDVGTQRSMIMSPAMWRRWIKPCMNSLIQTIKRINPAIYFRYHSDGVLTPIMPELIEMGVDSLITVQPESMDVFDFKRRFGRDICMEGTIGCQSELMTGTPDQVRSMVKAQCEGLMPGGGFIASPSNGVEPDVPWENLAMLYEALDQYGQYR